jgi:uncharacterized protein (DUF885 family)
MFGAAAYANDAAVNKLHALFDAQWERGLRESPTSATFYGDKRYNALWENLDPKHLQQELEEDRDVLKQLSAIADADLPPAEQLNKELFRRLYQHQIDLAHFQRELRPLDQLNYSNSIQTLSEMSEVTDFSTVKDYEDWIARLNGFGRYMDQTLALARRGLAVKSTQPRIVMERTLEQVKRQNVPTPEKSAFYSPFEHFPDSIATSEQQRLRVAGADAVSKVVLPAFAKLETFIEKEYLPKSRDSVGIWDSPDGLAFYQNQVEWFTTTKLTAGQIHEIGQSEVKRIRGEMRKVIDKVGFKGDFQAFLQHLRTDPTQRYHDPDELLRAYMVMTKKIDPLLPEYFGKLPREPYGVRAIPMSTAPDTTTAYYTPGSADGRRPGYFTVNLYKPEERPKYEIPVLTTHESVPGHHLQGALALELGELPNFRRDFEATAFVEGWGLYAESLGDEMGLYADPYDKFGQLTYEMWRAVRLVVDTGMHSKHWTRAQAIQFFKENTAKTELDIVNEIDRYIAWPGQATAYKIGELKIKELRKRATDKLGAKFDKRAFHDVVLGSGAIPLDILERNVDKWIAGQTG